jgi:hypothetical protein
LLRFTATSNLPAYGVKADDERPGANVRLHYAPFQESSTQTYLLEKK